mmetsp:Transcript_751/g.1789  ORF Transcript_751/g.1789 Transcript_751/m.1789 type:complete len:213 (+) Transcript_751:1645-2283(+)
MGGCVAAAEGSPRCFAGHARGGEAEARIRVEVFHPFVWEPREAGAERGDAQVHARRGGEGIGWWGGAVRGGGARPPGEWVGRGGAWLGATGEAIRGAPAMRGGQHWQGRSKLAAGAALRAFGAAPEPCHSPAAPPVGSAARPGRARCCGHASSRGRRAGLACAAVRKRGQGPNMARMRPLGSDSRTPPAEALRLHGRTHRRAAASVTDRAVK